MSRLFSTVSEAVFGVTMKVLKFGQKLSTLENVCYLITLGLAKD
jgi:hypothetical protein